jgi:hypothetical protein
MVPMIPDGLAPSSWLYQNHRLTSILRDHIHPDGIAPSPIPCQGIMLLLHYGCKEDVEGIAPPTSALQVRCTANVCFTPKCHYPELHRDTRIFTPLDYYCPIVTKNYYRIMGRLVPRKKPGTFAKRLPRCRDDCYNEYPV